MEHDFSKGSVSRHIMMQAVPLMIAQILQLLYNVVDRIYIGHLSGENGLALTGIGLVFPIISVISAFTNLFGMGGAPLCSIARGAGQNEKAKKIMGHSAVLLFGTSFFLMALCYLLVRCCICLAQAMRRTFMRIRISSSIWRVRYFLCLAMA